jgi:hypothetical protein
MKKLRLDKIIESLMKIDGAYQTGEEDINHLSKHSKIHILNAPDGFDSGPIGRVIPVYFPEDILDFPFNGEGEGESIEQLAWYRSYHYGASNWGIYILRSGVYKVANALISHGVEQHNAIALAQEFLIRHEKTHFQTDLGVTSLELASNSSLFIPTRKRIFSSSPSWHLEEEGLANSYAYRSLKKNKKFMEPFLKTSPIGYRNWKQYNKNSDLTTWEVILGEFISGTGGQPQLASNISNEVSLKFFEDIPIYEVQDIANRRTEDSYFIGTITSIKETSDFLKDLNKLCKGQPRYAKKWEALKSKLSGGNLVGVHFENISRAKSIYSVRMDDEARVGLMHESGWSAIAAGHHDELYRRLNRF